MSTVVQCARAIVAGEERRDFAFAIEGERITAAGPAGDVRVANPNALLRTHGGDFVVIPGFINGHSHAYQILLRGWADDLPFVQWRRDALYNVVPALTPDDVYWTFRLAFDEMLRAGITTVAEFFYLNGEGNAHAERAIEAAHDAGIRLVFARTWMDADYAPPAFRESAGQAAEGTRALMEAFPHANVCVAPHSLHAASPDMIRTAAEFARAQDCMLHVHVAEAAYEGEQTQRAFGATPIALLDRLGALDERTVAIHAIYISEEEKKRIASSGARVVHNPMTNQYLGDGICDITGLLRLGVPVALGTDADVNPSIMEEMRAASLLQKVQLTDGSALGAKAAFAMGTAQGAYALGLDAGELRAGAYADYAVVDACAIDEWSPAVNAIVYRGANAWIRETYVGGRLARTHQDRAPERALQFLRRLSPRLKMK